MREPLHENSSAVVIDDEPQGLRQSMTFRKLRQIKLRMGKPIKSEIPESTIVQQREKVQPLVAPSALRGIRIKCKICCEAFPKLPEIMSCRSHNLFCEDCSSNYLKTKIYDRAIPIQCQMANCNGTVDEKSSIFLGLDQKDRDMYYRLTKQLVDKRKPCRVPDCDGFLLDLTCEKCGRKHCPKCEEVQHPDQCIIATQITMNTIKKCPKCKVLIQKDKGCNHITCQCKHEFCFICLKNWNRTHHLCGKKSCGRKGIMIGVGVALLLLGGAAGVVFGLKQAGN